MTTTASEPVPPYSEKMHTSSSSENSLVRGRPRTMYYHGGIGGAGNYHVRNLAVFLPLLDMHPEHKSHLWSVAEKTVARKLIFERVMLTPVLPQKVIHDDAAEPTFNPRTQPRRSHLPKSLTGLFSSGVGGAGNMHSRAEEASLTQDEETARARIRESHFAKRWFVGIGGAGNLRGSRRQHSPSSDVTNTTAGSDYSIKPPSIGAAEVLRRKLLGR